MLQIGIHHKSSRAARGALAEKKTAALLRSMGYKVKRLYHGGSDLIVTNPTTGQTAKIEVKFSSKNIDGKYRATTIKNNATDHRKSDVIIFVCQGLGGRCTEFIIPTKIQKNKTFLCVTSDPVTYNGKLSKYRNAWHMLWE